MFFHKERGLRTLEHGDDYASVGSLEELGWMRRELENRFDMKTTTVGHSKAEGVAVEGKILNRIIRATAKGWEYECDQRHVEVLIEQLDLASAKPLSTPGVDEPVEVSQKDVEDGIEKVAALLEGESATQYRALAARCNYIAVDRADAQYCTKELCRDMSAPTMESWKRLVRLGRYFLGKPRAVIGFAWQPEADCYDIFTDANWAGCRVSRKSTSGGVVMLGRCCIKTWSKTQSTIAQSSAESELLATVRGATEGIGLISLAVDLGLSLKVRLHIDAAAALGIIERRGVGRVRHLDVGTLWLQEQQLRKVVNLHKVPGLENPGDLLTKNLSQERVAHYSELIGYSYVGGRAALTSGLHSTKRVDEKKNLSTKIWIGDAPNRCQGCGRSFRSQNMLRAHLVRKECEAGMWRTRC